MINSWIAFNKSKWPWIILVIGIALALRHFYKASVSIPTVGKVRGRVIDFTGQENDYTISSDLSSGAF